MPLPMFKQRSVNAHNFSMIPRADIPRSKFRMQHSHKTTISAGALFPVYLQEVLPGDSFSLKMTAFSRMATMIYPIMDNLHLETFFFFVPNRLVWDNWQRFMGEQDNPADSISYVVPQVVSPVGGFERLNIADYFGLPCSPNLGSNTLSVSALPFRAYNLVYNQWFRDENLQGSVPVPKGDGPDPVADYAILRRGKRHDYFTSALPFAQKGPAVPLPLGGQAIVKTSNVPGFTTGTDALKFGAIGGSWVASDNFPLAMNTTTTNTASLESTGVIGKADAPFVAMYPSNLYADLSDATASTINALRLAFQVQRLLERDARGGTRYTELVRSHFGVVSPDARLQRAEYLGGGSSPIQVSPIAQSQRSDADQTPLGTLAGVGANVAREHGFSQSFTEHGHVIGLMEVRADLAYQQGVKRMWSRSTKYDFYWPVFSHLGEQAVLNKEIYCDGSAVDAAVFGYQERWAEYRYFPSMVTGYFNSTNPTPLDAWHLAQSFGSVPTLNSGFIEDQTDQVVSRAVAIGAASEGQQFLCDIFFDCIAARAMPMYSVPGLIDHF